MLESRGIGLRLLTAWTIDYAATALAIKLGWHHGARDSFVKRMIEAAESGALVVRDPHTDLPYRPKVIRAGYDLAWVSDVDAWLQAQRVPYRLGDPPSHENPPSLLTTKSGQMVWELRSAIQALAVQREWSKDMHEKMLERAIRAATVGTLVTRDKSLDGLPIRGDREARISTLACFVFTDDINDWLRNVEKAPYQLIEDVAQSEQPASTKSSAPNEPEPKGVRLAAEHAALLQAGCKKPTKTLAEREGISVSRVRAAIAPYRSAAADLSLDDVWKAPKRSKKR